MDKIIVPLVYVNWLAKSIMEGLRSLLMAYLSTVVYNSKLFYLSTLYRVLDQPELVISSRM